MPWHRDDFDSEEAWQWEAFRLGYDNAEQREAILDAGTQDERVQLAGDLVDTRRDQGDFQSMGTIYADIWDSMDPDYDRDDAMDEIFDY